MPVERAIRSSVTHSLLRFALDGTTPGRDHWDADDIRAEVHGLTALIAITVAAAIVNIGFVYAILFGFEGSKDSCQ